MEEVIWVTDLLSQILTNKKALFGWVEVMGTLGEVTEWEVKTGDSQMMGSDPFVAGADQITPLCLILLICKTLWSDRMITYLD